MYPRFGGVFLVEYLHLSGVVSQHSFYAELRKRSSQLLTPNTHFAKAIGAFITSDGEAIEGDALDDVHVLGVVTFTIIDVRENKSPV